MKVICGGRPRGDLDSRCVKCGEIVTSSTGVCHQHVNLNPSLPPFRYVNVIGCEGRGFEAVEDGEAR